MAEAPPHVFVMPWPENISGNRLMRACVCGIAGYEGMNGTSNSRRVYVVVIQTGVLRRLLDLHRHVGLISCPTSIIMQAGFSSHMATSLGFTRFCFDRERPARRLTSTL